MEGRAASSLTTTADIEPESLEMIQYYYPTSLTCSLIKIFRDRVHPYSAAILYKAALRGQIDVAGCLFDIGVDPNIELDQEGRTALQVAAYGHQPKMIVLLSQAVDHHLHSTTIG